MNEMEKKLVVIDIGENIFLYLNIFDILNFVLRIINFELYEEINFINYFEISKIESFLKVYVRFQKIQKNF